MYYYVLEIPEHITLGQNLIVCSTLRQEYCKLIGLYRKIMRWQLCPLTCAIHDNACATTPIHSLSTVILSTKVFQAFQVFFLTLPNKMQHSNYTFNQLLSTISAKTLKLNLNIKNTKNRRSDESSQYWPRCTLQMP